MIADTCTNDLYDLFGRNTLLVDYSDAPNSHTRKLPTLEESLKPCHQQTLACNDIASFAGRPAATCAAFIFRP